LCLIDKGSDWFTKAVKKKVGNGLLTSFWNDPWIGDQSLRQRFPRLFGISTQKDEVIGNLGHIAHDVWVWNLQWRRSLFVWEEDQYGEFLNVITPFMPSDRIDTWLWLDGDIQGFTANSAYLLLAAEYIPPVERDLVFHFVFKNLWKCGAPSKVCAFAWQLLLDRIPTKDNLLKRRIIQPAQGVCVFCGLAPESSTHLFLHCRGAAKVWYDVSRWLGFFNTLPHTIVSSLAMLLLCAKNKKERGGLCLIWAAYVWVIWSIRNDIIFNNGVLFLDDVVEQVKLVSWKWYVGRVAKGPFLLYEWKWSALDCMS
jgi:hypothetical protein